MSENLEKSDKRILIVGSVAYDSVESLEGKVKRALGGAATYASIAAGYYCSPCLVGVVGEDFEEEHLDYLKNSGVDLTGLQVKPGKTFHWSGKYLPDMIGRETLSTELNVFEDFDPVLPDELVGLDYIFLANIHPMLQKKVLDQAKSPKFVLMDTMDLWINIAKEGLLELLPKVDVLVINDEEVRLLTGDYNVIRGARNLLDQGVKRAVIVKRGEHGSSLVTLDSVSIAPAYPVTSLVDPTGAGDTFAGALIGFLAGADDLNHQNLRRALLHGAAVASFTVEDFSLGKLKGIGLYDIEERLVELKKIMVFD
jgi:sugar/nucleoside kinase (ribokinase family)